jgi:DNA-binding transcriptional MerR regulator
MVATGEPMLNIGELASLTGVSSRTIRYYEELGILPEPQRSAGGTRRYPRDYRFYIEGARALKDLGFSLDEIRTIGQMALGRRTTAAQRDGVAAVVRERTSALEHRIRVLTRLRELLTSQEERETGGDGDDREQAIAGLAGIVELHQERRPG